MTLKNIISEKYYNMMFESHYLTSCDYEEILLIAIFKQARDEYSSPMINKS